MTALRVCRAAAVAALMMLFALFVLIPVSAQQKELEGGWQAIAIYKDMVGKSLSQIKGDCDVALAWGAYSTKKQPSPTEGNWVRLHWQDDSRTITSEMVGSGLWIFTPENVKCNLKSKGYDQNLGKSSRLSQGWNFISVSKGMVGKSFEDMANTCTVEKVRLYSPNICKLAGVAEAEGIQCSGDYLIIGDNEKLSEFYLGKGIWVKVASDCTLDDGTPAEVLCNQAECAAKSGCYGSDYVTYGCKDNSCAEISRRRTCTADEKAKQGVDLVPRAEIKPSTVPSLAQMEAGDEAEIAAYIGNEGTLSTTVHAIEKQQLSYTVKVAIEKISADGKTATLVATEYKVVSMVDKDIPLQGEAKVMSFVWKPAAEGSYRVKIAVDINKEVTEAGEAGELNNEKIYELVVKPASTRLPDLVVGEGKISVIPKVLCRPATVSTITATVKNIGRTPANAQGQFLEAKVYVKEGGNVICSSLRMQNPPRWLVTINPGEEFTFMNLELTDSGGGECILQPGKDYVAAVDVDTLKAVTESNEDNTFSAPIVDETKCEEAATRQGSCYCDFDKKPKTQRKAFEVCSHNFECQTETCIRNRCVSEAQKKDILKILGIG